MSAYLDNGGAADSDLQPEAPPMTDFPHLRVILITAYLVLSVTQLIQAGHALHAGWVALCFGAAFAASWAWTRPERLAQHAVHILIGAGVARVASTSTPQLESLGQLVPFMVAIGGAMWIIEGIRSAEDLLTDAEPIPVSTRRDVGDA